MSAGLICFTLQATFPPAHVFFCSCDYVFLPHLEFINVRGFSEVSSSTEAANRSARSCGADCIMHMKVGTHTHMHLEPPPACHPPACLPAHPHPRCACCRSRPSCRLETGPVPWALPFSILFARQKLTWQSWAACRNAFSAMVCALARMIRLDGELACELPHPCPLHKLTAS